MTRGSERLTLTREVRMAYLTTAKNDRGDKIGKAINMDSAKGREK